MEQINKVLKAYAVYPLSIEKITNRLVRIDDGKQSYALKKSVLTEDTLSNWKTVYQYAQIQNLSSILPVYLTRNGDLYTKSQHSFYYLTPWIEGQNRENHRQTIEQFYHMIGTIHGKTKQSQLLQTDKLIERFHTYKTFCSKTKDMLLEYVEKFEKHRYMSPFELLVCTQYRNLEYALNMVNQQIDQFLEGGDEQLSWHDYLCHGNLMLSHSVNPYIINWEHAHQGSAILDLAHFFQQEIVYYDNPSELLIELFSTYHKENELSLKEQNLLTIYLLNPASYASIVQTYNSSSSAYSMIEQIQHLQHAYRKITFGLQWSDYVKKEYEEDFSLDDLES